MPHGNVRGVWGFLFKGKRDTKKERILSAIILQITKDKMETKPLKEFVEEIFQGKNAVKTMKTPTMTKLLELSALQDWFNVMWGVRLEINVVPAEPMSNNFFSKEASQNLDF